jgi:hypothetical protein
MMEFLKQNKRAILIAGGLATIAFVVQLAPHDSRFTPPVTFSSSVNLPECRDIELARELARATDDPNDKELLKLKRFFAINVPGNCPLIMHGTPVAIDRPDKFDGARPPKLACVRTIHEIDAGRTDCSWTLGEELFDR